MTTPEDVIEYLDVRSKWPHEALDFTPWLAGNLDLLSEATGLNLELVQEEAAVGSFSCDILAREVNSGISVAIENQLEWSDHSHLTQMLTYAAGLDARIGIWVAPEFRYEHAATLNWLNEWTHDELRFYGVKVELVKTGDSSYKPRLQCVVFPGEWNKDITQPEGAYTSPRSQQFYEFFQPLIRPLLQERFAEKAIQHFGAGGRLFPSRFREGTGYAISFEGENGAWVTLQIRTEDRNLTKHIFDELIKDRGSIESSIAADPAPDWRWHRNDREAFSCVHIRRDGSIYDPKDKLKETRDWMLEMLPKFKEIFDPRLAEIFSNLPGGDSA